MEKMNPSLFNLMKNKEIIYILQGDTILEESNDIRIAMPYLSGPTIVNISNQFGHDLEYGWAGGAASRWQYMESMLDYGIQNGRINDILCFLFSKKSFISQLKNLTPEQIETLYNSIVQKAIDRINGILYFSEAKLTFNNKQFLISLIDSKVEVLVTSVKNIDREYIKNISERSLEDISNGHYDSAITKSRTLLEEVFCYVIEAKGEEPTETGDIGKLYKQVRELYNMHTNKNLDKRLNKLLSGLDSIVSSIAEMRNTYSDSHGIGMKRINVSDYHANLVVNSAMTMSEFILSVANKSQELSSQSTL